MAGGLEAALTICVDRYGSWGSALKVGIILHIGRVFEELTNAIQVNEESSRLWRTIKYGRTSSHPHAFFVEDLNLVAIVVNKVQGGEIDWCPVIGVPRVIHRRIPAVEVRDGYALPPIGLSDSVKPANNVSKPDF